MYVLGEYYNSASTSSCLPIAPAIARETMPAGLMNAIHYHKLPPSSAPRWSRVRGDCASSAHTMGGKIFVIYILRIFISRNV